MTACPKCSGSMSLAKMMLLQSVSVGTQITATLQGLKLAGPRLQPKWLFFSVAGALASIGGLVGYLSDWEDVAVKICAFFFWGPAALVLGWVLTPWRRKAEARAAAHAEWLERTWVCTACGHEVPAE